MTNSVPHYIYHLSSCNTPTEVKNPHQTNHLPAANKTDAVSPKDSAEPYVCIQGLNESDTPRSNPTDHAIICDREKRYEIETRSVKELQEIMDLKLKLRVQADSKIDIVNQCLQMQERITQNETMPVQSYYVKTLEEENIILKYAKRNKELRYTIELGKMKDQANLIEKEINNRNERIRWLEAEILRRKHVHDVLEARILR